ncbi:MAG: HAMP domain-containing histidine kinase [Bradymonadales bacterium]|nr:HAMP domain-containing histidine kinase [Bradymonadales bacterium]
MLRPNLSRFFTSLTAKVLFWVTFIAGATFLAVVMISTLVAKRVVTQQILAATEAAAEGMAQELAAAVDPVALVGQPQWPSKLVGRLSLSPGWRGVHAEIRALGRSTSVSASPSTTPPQPLISFAEVPLGQRRSEFSGDYLELVLRRELQSGDLSIRMFASTEEIHSVLNLINRNATWMGCAAWVVLVLTVAWLIYRTITRPLREIATRMGEVAEGRLAQRVEVAGASEVYPLIQAFNQMSNELAETEQERSQLMKEVEDLNRQLQERVEAATAALATAQESLARRDRLAAMGELVGTIAHEVGTPLNSILAHLDLLAEDLPIRGDNSQRLQIVVREIERISDVIRRYLRTTRPPEPQSARVSIEVLLQEAVRVFEIQAALSGIRFVTRTDSAWFSTDPVLLTQIIRNLVSNALNAVDTGGTVSLTALVSQGRLTLTIRDDGVGMDTETQRRLFEPFFTARRDHTGTGLGMPVVRHAVSALGGQISVTSQPQEGTTIEVEIPEWVPGEEPDESLPPSRNTGVQP